MKKNLRTLLLVVCAMISVSVNAQEEKNKPNLLVEYFTSPTDLPDEWEDNLRNCVIEGINATSRVNVLDDASKYSLDREKARRSNEDLDSGGDMERLAKMRSEVADFILMGDITSMVTEKKKLDDGTPYFGATCAYTLKVVSTANGKVVSTKNFKHGDGITNIVNGDTEGEAISKVCRQAVKAMRELVEDAFKIEGEILQYTTVKKDEAKEVYISIGSAHGVGAGAYFDACIEREIAGRKSQKVIGELKVKDVEGEDLTLCEVKKGGAEIKKALDDKQKVVVKTKQKVSMFDKMKKAANSL